MNSVFMTTLTREIKIALMLGICLPVVSAQDSFTISGPSTPAKATSENEPIPPLKHTAKIYKEGKSIPIDSESIICEQEQNGALKFAFVDSMTNEEKSIIIPPIDNFGYYPLKKFLKDIERDKQSKWEKCKKQLASKYRSYKQGKPVDLTLVPIASMRDAKGAELIFGLRPEYINSEDSSKIYYEADAYLQIRFKGKMIITKFFGYYYGSSMGIDKFEKWLIQALKYQLSLAKE